MQENQAIINCVGILLQKIAFLEKRIACLEEKLSRYEHPKNSSNSSAPPSQDPFRIKRTASLREKSGKKPGGQKGHPGSGLAFSVNPDETIEHKPDYCSVCGRDLSNEAAVFAGKRQVTDIPPTVPVITEHRIYSRQCSCGHCQVSEYPQEAHGSVCYGENLTGLTAYFHSRQYIPFERMREMYRDIFNLHVSAGSLAGMIQRFAAKSANIYEIIRSRIALSAVVGADETGVCIKGKYQWAWTFQPPRATFIRD
jgi:transposase